MPLSLNKAKKWLDAHGMGVVIGGMTAFTVSFCALSFWKYAHLGYTGFDLAYYNQIFWRTLHGEFFRQSFLVPQISLGHHVEAIIPALVPFYAIFPDPRTLLALQVLALALPAIPLFLIAKHRLGAMSSAFLRTALPIFFPLAWLANPFVHVIALDEFHLFPFALAPLFFAALAYEKQRRWPFVLLLLLALLTHERVAAVVIAFGSLAWLERRPSWWLITPSLLGGVWHALSLHVILRFDPSMRLAIFPADLSGDAFGAAFSVAGGVISLPTIAALIALGLPFLLLSFAAPHRTVLAALPLLQLLIGSTDALTVISGAAVALLLPGVFLAAIDGARAAPRITHLLSGGIGEAPRGRIVLLLAAATAFSATMLGPVPASVRNLLRGTDTATILAAEAIIERIAPTDTVAAPPALLPNVSGRFHLVPLPTDPERAKQALLEPRQKPDIIILDARATRTSEETPPFTIIVP
jgi:uncharacterized membrane protein